MKVETRDGDDGAILLAMRKMRDDLAHAVGSIRETAGEVGTAAQQIAQGNQQLSSRTEEQASSLEETAASMEELAGTVKQNSENARQANELATNASRRAEQGGTEVGVVVATMNDISRSANRIAEIISVIDGIAFQTNILALNAAVEAARAGEQGRGFAVVASEVRSLAQRSAQAAKEIKDLIGASVEQVGRGSKAVEKAGSTIGALVGDVKNVSELMHAIAEASHEQARGVEQVNRTVTEMDKVVQHNASAVQESVTAAEAMRAQAESLLRAVSAFRLGEEEATPAPAPVARVARAERLESPAEESFAPKLPPARPSVARAPASTEAVAEDWKEF
jgi:methyl-accepting chemotaxis protein